MKFEIFLQNAARILITEWTTIKFEIFFTGCCKDIDYGMDHYEDCRFGCHRVLLPDLAIVWKYDPPAPFFPVLADNQGLLDMVTRGHCYCGPDRREKLVCGTYRSQVDVILTIMLQCIDSYIIIVMHIDWSALDSHFFFLFIRNDYNNYLNAIVHVMRCRSLS